MIREAVQEDCQNLAALSIQVWLHTYATEGIRKEESIASFGLALITTYNIVCLCISMGMVVYFIAFEIPRLDEHLNKKYGNEFAEYSQVTKKFVPFVY